MTEGTLLQKHLDEFNEIVIDLGNLHEIIKEEHKVMLFLCSLPPSYKTFKEVFLYSNQTNVSFKQVKSAAISKDIGDREGSTGTGKQFEALFVKEGFEMNGEKQLTCYYCKNKGHVKADCYKLKATQKLKKEKKPKKADKQKLELHSMNMILTQMHLLS